MNKADDDAVERRHLAALRQIRGRLFMQHAFWKEHGHQGTVAAKMLIQLDRLLELNASLIAMAERKLGR